MTAVSSAAAGARGTFRIGSSSIDDRTYAPWLFPATAAATPAVLALAAAPLAAAGFSAAVATSGGGGNLGRSGFTTSEERQHGSDDGRKFHGPTVNLQVGWRVKRLDLKVSWRVSNQSC